MKPTDVEVAGARPPPPAINGYGGDASNLPDPDHKPVSKRPWYRTRTCIITSSAVGVILLGVIIAVAVLGASYLEGQASSLPDATLTCSANCYTADNIAELNAPWARVLAETVSDGMIDGVPVAVVAYESVDLSPESDLRTYTGALATLDLERVPESEAIALLINAYNAFTVQLIAANLEGLTSIKQLSTAPFPRTTWNTRKFDFGGFSVTLDDIEHGNIRGRFDEPRIHAAVNCASVSCPDLRAQPYTGSDIDTQLDEQMRIWINNPLKGLSLDTTSNTLYLSKLFDWYGGDFKPLSVEEAACQYADGNVCQYLQANEVKTRFMDYNWNLNSLASSNSAALAKDPELEVVSNDPLENYERVLKRIVSEGVLDDTDMNVVDYTQLSNGNDAQLLSYLDWLATVDLAAMTWDEQLATLINAYNAFTVHLIASNYQPGLSILDLDGGNPWDTRRFQSTWEMLTLNQIEHERIRQVFGEPRIHAAVNCASVSCPDLRAEPYTAANLDAQLQEQMNIWLNNEKKGLEIDVSGSRPALYLSAIFDWYEVDFLPSAPEYACQFVDATFSLSDGEPEVDLCTFLAQTPYDVSYIEYNWNLNQGMAKPPSVPPSPPMEPDLPSATGGSGAVDQGSMSGRSR